MQGLFLYELWPYVPVPAVLPASARWERVGDVPSPLARSVEPQGGSGCHPDRTGDRRPPMATRRLVQRRHQNCPPSGGVSAFMPSLLSLTVSASFFVTCSGLVIAVGSSPWALLRSVPLP